MNKFEVTILNHKYTIKCDEDREYIERVAEYVNRKVRDITESTRVAATVQVAVLAALNIADDCLKLEREVTKLEDRSRELVRLIDEKDSGSKKEDYLCGVRDQQNL